MADITVVKQALAQRAQSVAEYLLPQGRKDGQEWRAGSVDGEKGQSLGVHLVGAKAGVWTDFNGGAGGDLIDLWAAVRRIGVGEALREAKGWLGIADTVPAFAPKRAYVRPRRPECAAPKGAVFDYLVRERKLPIETLALYKVGEQGGTIVFPFLLPNGELALAKLRDAEDGAKPKPSARDCEPILFGWQAVPANAREIIITEGEIDAMSWAAYGHPAMSVPFGGGGGNKQQWIENEFERLERFEKIYLATDMDKPGDEAAAEIAQRLGRHRCFRVSMPHKDANECRKQGVTAEAMTAALRDAASLDPEGLRKPTDFTAKVARLFHPQDGDHQGYETPYRGLGQRLLFRPAEVSLWSGASGAGKSQILSDCTVGWINQGSRICVSSLEMRAEMTLKRLLKQMLGIERPAEQAIAPGLSWLEQGLLLYDALGKATPELLIEVFNYARAKYGCDQFVVDSLMRLGVASDDYVGQEKAVFRLVDWAVASSVHLHLVAHSRKGSGQGGSAPETEDVKGASEIGANAFNIITVWRNRNREDKLAIYENMLAANSKFEPDQAKEYEKLLGESDAIMNVAKQRNGDFEGKVRLWFNKQNYRYRSSEDKNFNRSYMPLTDIRKYWDGYDEVDESNC